MRVVTTNDFVGSFFPQPTSYGALPGAAALSATVEDLGGVWIDTGDLAQGSALGALSDGVWPFLALRELPIAVAVAGNHELDWGEAHLRRWAAELPFPLLAANLPLGLPATWTVGELGVIGMSLPGMAELHPGRAAASDTAGLVREHAAALRAGGARRVVLALHDGVDADGPARMRVLCERVRGGVDLVLGGHTLRCFAGELAGVPFLQPWAFGNQVGVADLHDDGRVRLRLLDVAPPRPWTGPGAGAQAALEAEIVGRLGRPLAWAVGRDTALPEAIGAAVLRSDDALGRVHLGPGDTWNQPARDGVHAFLPAGEVSLAQVLRLAPFCGARSAWGGQLVAAEVPPGAERALGPYGVTVGRGDVLALSPFHAAALGDHGWRPVAATFRDGLLAAVRDDEGG